jgi:prepilin-type N-terminal cleavage/methylation domain-containing protein
VKFPRRQTGVTLIELMITLIVVAIVLSFAIPSFIESRQRAAVRGAADQIAAFWADARFEALRRNIDVRVTMRSDANGQICLGANRVPDATPTATCDCFTAGSCNVATWPENQAAWRGVRVPGLPTLGSPDDDALGDAVIDPKRGELTDPTHVGVFSLQSPAGANTDYRLNVSIDRHGRAYLCEPSAAPSKLPQYADRRC